MIRSGLAWLDLVLFHSVRFVFLLVFVPGTAVLAGLVTCVLYCRRRKGGREGVYRIAGDGSSD